MSTALNADNSFEILGETDYKNCFSRNPTAVVDLLACVSCGKVPLLPLS